MATGTDLAARLCQIAASRPGRLLAAAVLSCSLAQASFAAASGTADLPPGLEEAVALYRAEGAAVALPRFQELQDRYRAGQDLAAEGMATRYVGESYWRLGQLDRSRVALEEAISLARVAGDARNEGRALNVLGLLEWDAGSYQEALTSFRAAHAIAERTDDRRLAASTLNNRGLVRDELGQYAASLQDFEDALRLFEQAGDRRGQGDALGNIGGVNLLLGRYREALVYYQRALTISEALGSKPSMGIDHGNIALSLLGLGRSRDATEHFDEALRLARETGMSQEEAYWQRGKAGALVSRGRYDLGLEQYRASLAIYEATGARNDLLDAQHDMGMLMLTLGDAVAAETWFRRAVALSREIGHQRALTENQLALGDLELERGRHEEARALYDQALRRAMESGETTHQARALLRLARLDRVQGHNEMATQRGGEALGLAQQNAAAALEAESWFALAEADRGRSAGERALAAYERAEQVAGSDGDPDLLWQIHYGRARTLEQTGFPEAAVESLERAVRVIEGVRDRLREERFRAGWIEDKYQVYIDLVRLQIELGRTRDAFATAERLRARSFLAQLEKGPLSGAGPDEGRREAALRQRVRHLQRTLLVEQERPPPERRQAAIETFSMELAGAEREYQAVLDDRLGSPGGLGGIRVPEVEEIQGRLAPGDALIEFVTGHEQLTIFVLRRDRLAAVTREAPIAELTARVNLLRELIQQPGEDTWRKPASALASLLMDPLQDEALLDGVRHVSLVPHGILNYLPFALLPLAPDTGRVLVDEYTVSYLPAAAVLGVARGSAGRRPSVLALAPSVAQLQFAPREARSVAGMFEPESMLLLGTRATETAVKAQAGDFELVHFATHGHFNARNPLLSGLKLEADAANDGLLEVHEILELSLHAELVAMSACQTGLASGWFSDIPAGDEFVGLTRAFLVAGSRAVLASLWEVDDLSTVSLMEGFYRELSATSLTTGQLTDQAAALAHAQREMRQSAEFNHPFYWAPFVLVGQHGQGAVRKLSKRG